MGAVEVERRTIILERSESDGVVKDAVMELEAEVDVAEDEVITAAVARPSKLTATKSPLP